MKFEDLFEDEDEKTSEVLVLLLPRTLRERLDESVLEEGKRKKYDNAHDIRYDRRPADQGGDQLHIWNRNGDRFAYRSTGDKSEPGKYTVPATMAVKKIVRDTFKLPPNTKIECTIRQADRKRCFLRIALLD